jgi:hypothetical protein
VLSAECSVRSGVDLAPQPPLLPGVGVLYSNGVGVVFGYLAKHGVGMALTLLAVEPPLRFDKHQVVRVGKSRVTLDSVIADFKAGSSAESIAEHYPAISLAEVYAVLAYYLRYQDEVEEYLREQAVAEAAARDEVERRFPTAGLRERLLARRGI